MAPVAGVGEVSLFRLGADVVSLGEIPLLGWIPGEAHAVSLCAAKVNDVVPPIRDGSLNGESVVEPVTGSRCEVVVGNRVVEKKTPRVVPIVLGLDHFLTGRRDELPDIDPQSFADGSEIGEVGFLQILSEAHSCYGLAAIDGIDRLAEAEGHVIAGPPGFSGRRIWPLVDSQLDHVQAELVRIGVEEASATHQARRMIEIEAVLGVNKSVERRWPKQA